MKTRRPIITLLTDFGERDAYVGVMKGVILSIVPDAQVIDISHQIEPQNIRQAASALSEVYPFYPPHTVHVVVVDPGVGSERQPIALETQRGRFVAPDNGVLTHVRLAEPSSSAFLLNNQRYWLASTSHTFHGRDIFSPVAAHMAGGVPLADLAAPLDSIHLLEMPLLAVSPASVRGEVTGIDNFGNVLTNIGPLRWLDDSTVELQPQIADSNVGGKALTFNSSQVRVTCGWHTLNGLHTTYSAVSPGQALALVGSSDALEIAVNQGSASANLSIKVGDPVTLNLD